MVYGAFYEEFGLFQRTADSLGQVSRREEGLDEVLEDPDEIIAGFIN